MRIGEVASRSGIPAKTLRFYEQAGVLVPPRRQGSGYRDYDEDVLARLAFIKAAQAAGLTLAEIRQIIDLRDGNGPPCEHVTKLLDAHAQDLDRRIDGLIALRDEVDRLRSHAATLDPSDCRPIDVCHVVQTRSEQRDEI